MDDYFYMRPVYHSGSGALSVYSDQKGSVTRDPLEAYQRYRLAFERGWVEKFGERRLDRQGLMFAYWRLPGKMPWHEAMRSVRDTAPDRVCVLTESHSWRVIELRLPPGELLDFEQYPSTLPKTMRNVPRETSGGTE